MNISDEAVTAAAQALYADIADGDPWDTADVDDVSEVMQMALNVLKAAAPHLMAHRTVTTIEELNALPFGSVILDGAGLSLHKNEFAGWRASNGAKNITAEMLEQEALPATVLHEPVAAGAGE